MVIKLFYLMSEEHLKALTCIKLHAISFTSFYILMMNILSKSIWIASK